MPVYKHGVSLDDSFKNGAPVSKIVHYGNVAWERLSTTYDVELSIVYSAGAYILANGTRTATVTVTRKTYINGVYQSGSDVVVDADSTSVVSQPSGCNFSITRTGTGTYTISASSRGTTYNLSTEAVLGFSYTPPAGAVINKTISVYQEANNYSTSYSIIAAKLNNYNGNITVGDAANTVNLSGTVRRTYTYTSGSSSYTDIALGSSNYSVSGTGFTYSNSVVSVSANSGAERYGTVYFSYSGAATVSRTITQASVVLPSVITNLAQVSGYGTSATIALSGQVTSWGSGSASSYGIRYKLSSSGTWTNLSCSNLSSGVFSVSPDLTGIPAGTYDYQAYATSSVGVTGYGDSNQFTVASAPSYSISVSPSGYLSNQGGSVQVTVTSSHGWNATVNKGDFFRISISASSGVSGDTPTISILTPFANGTYNGNVTFTCGTATHVFHISVTIGL